MAELKREVGQIKLTLSNFEQEMTRIIIQMRDDNALLKEKNHEDKLRNAENQREEAAKRTEKLENANEQLHIEIINLKEKNSNLNKECENLRKCISTRTEAQNQLTKEIESKTTEINDLRRQQDQIQKHATEKKEAATREGETYAQKVKSDRHECPTIETGNRFSPLIETVQEEGQYGAYHVKDYADPLSNFYRCKFYWNRKKFYSLEHAFQYEKAVCHGQYDTARQVLNARHAGIANKIGRSIRLDPQWDQDKDEIMYAMLQAKHQQCHTFRRSLNQTGQTPILIDIPDRYWGTGTDGRGSNKIGTFLVELRQSKTTEGESTDRQRKPIVAIFGSSLIKNMDARRFSRRYNTDIQLSYTIPEAKRNVSEYNRKADVVVYQLLSNDIKEKSTNDCVKEMKELIRQTESIHRQSKIVISLPTNRGDSRELNNKINIVNASAKVEFQNYDNVLISDNSNLSYRGEPNRRMISADDGVHPTEFGEKVLFQNIRKSVDQVLYGCQNNSSVCVIFYRIRVKHRIRHVWVVMKLLKLTNTFYHYNIID
ncbi:hypothetical protein FSP39_004960 [Pinctada imbricata]|uniref:NADAR domain-containing protein n=1 Tax=Pinctada imbricata TaxID=66713 RepID=A0AA89BPW4_PINIB|nr:hypothetical protein FSP39_004960 [Pinctada imbricata]